MAYENRTPALCSGINCVHSLSGLLLTCVFWSFQRSCQTPATSANSQSSSSHSLSTRPWFRFRHRRGAPSTRCISFQLAVSSTSFFFALSCEYTNVQSIHSLCYSWLRLKPSLKLLHEARKWVFLFFFFNPEAQNICSRNSFPCFYPEISLRNLRFHQGNILWFMTFFIVVTHLLITRSFSRFVRYASWLKLWSVAWASALQPRNLLVEYRFTSRGMRTKEVSLGELLLSSRRDAK